MANFIDENSLAVVVVEDVAFSSYWDGNKNVPNMDRIYDEMTTLVSDTAYGVSWASITDQAPSMKAVYDKVQTLVGGTISDTAYGPSWNGVTTVAPSQNALYDKIESLAITMDDSQVALIAQSFT